MQNMQVRADAMCSFLCLTLDVLVAASGQNVTTVWPDGVPEHAPIGDFGKPLLRLSNAHCACGE